MKYEDDFWTQNAPPGEPPLVDLPANPTSLNVQPQRRDPSTDQPPPAPPGSGPTPPPTTPPTPPPNRGTTTPAYDPSWSTPQGALNNLLKEGNSPQQAVAAVNKQFGLKPGNEAVYYPPGTHGPNDRGTIGLSGGYLALGADDTWGWNTRGPEGPTTPPGGGGGNRYGGFTTAPGFYTSNPNYPQPPDAPQWTGGNFVEPTLPTTLQTPYALPTLEQLKASPGYQARLDAQIQAQQRSAAARGSVLSGGSQIELQRMGEDYASNEYGNLVGQSLSARGQQFGEFQTGRGNLFQDYQTKYGQFLDSANLGQQAYQNRYGAYMQDNARTLTDYLTNVSTQRNFQGDYWNRLKDLRDPGANLAGGSYKPPQ